MSEKKDFFNVEDFIGKAIKIYKKEGEKSMEDYFYNQRKETISLMSKTMLQSMEQILLNIKDHYDNNKDKYIEKDIVFEPLFDLENTATCILSMLGIDKLMLNIYLEKTTKNGKINGILFRSLKRLKKIDAAIFNRGYVNALEEFYRGTLIKLCKNLDNITDEQLNNKEFTEDLKNDAKFIIEFVKLSYSLFDIQEEDKTELINKLYEVANNVKHN